MKRNLKWLFVLIGIVVIIVHQQHRSCSWYLPVDTPQISGGPERNAVSGGVDGGLAVDPLCPIGDRDDSTACDHGDVGAELPGGV